MGKKWFLNKPVRDGKFGHNLRPGGEARMDERTLGAYDREAAAFAREWHAQPAASDMHALIGRFFGFGSTADMGCGSGRDTAWLDENGFPAVGYDASEGLLA